jgi:hypothetical protein
MRASFILSALFLALGVINSTICAVGIVEFVGSGFSSGWGRSLGFLSGLGCFLVSYVFWRAGKDDG